MIIVFKLCWATFYPHLFPNVCQNPLFKQKYIKIVSCHNPSVANPGPLPATVCANKPSLAAEDSECCDWSASIEVKLCPLSVVEDSYYVYKLTAAPECEMAYCAGDGVPCQDGHAWDYEQETCYGQYSNNMWINCLCEADIYRPVCSLLFLCMNYVPCQDGHAWDYELEACYGQYSNNMWINCLWGLVICKYSLWDKVVVCSFCS